MIHPTLPFVLLSIVILLLLLEIVLVSRSLKRIPIRILVNGTRGKSSTVEYIAAGLRASGTSTFAKITGVTPAIILSDSDREIIQRRGPARVQEQISMLLKASRLKAQAIVLENMSLKPEYQRLESRMLKPTIYVITNILDDHREEMGAAEEERVRAFCSAIPSRSTIVTIDSNHRQIIEDESKKRESSITFVDPEQENNESFPTGVFPENLKLARTVCRLAGVDDGESWKGMMNHVRENAKCLQPLLPALNGFRFINGFAVNDVPSSERFLGHHRIDLPENGQFILILNTRADRPLRTVQFARWCVRRKDITEIVLIGTHQWVAKRVMISEGCLGEKIHRWKKHEIDGCRKYWEGSGAVVVGLGNIAGDGFRMLAALR